VLGTPPADFRPVSPEEYARWSVDQRERYRLAVESYLYEVIDALAPRLREFDRETAREYVGFGEYGVAVHHLLYGLSDAEVPLRDAERVELRALALAMHDQESADSLSSCPVLAPDDPQGADDRASG